MEKICFSPIEKSLAKYIRDIKAKFVLVTHPHLFTLYGKKINQIFQKENKHLDFVFFEEGEKNKTRHTKEKIEDFLAEKDLQKDTCLIALGGGVVLDMTGFVCATYMRGIKSVYIPTTLLAMCDASVGGKCAVNTNFGKNQIGTFYETNAVFIDESFLQTLDEKNMQNGFVELVKHFLLCDRELFFSFKEEKNLSKNLFFYLKKSIAIKQKILLQDRREKNIRQILNFGHSIAHVIESISDYTIEHGQAVAIGIIAESILSHQMGYLSCYCLENIFALFSKYLPRKKIFLSKEKIWFFLQKDKKNRKGKIHFILLQEIGKVVMHEKYISHPIEEEKIISSLLKLEKMIPCLSVH